MPSRPSAWFTDLPLILGLKFWNILYILYIITIYYFFHIQTLFLHGGVFFSRVYVIGIIYSYLIDTLA